MGLSTQIKEILAVMGIGNVNATITIFTPASNPTSFDPVTGAPIFSNTTTVIDASLEEAQRPIEVNYPGTDSGYIYLEGRAIAPSFLPENYKPYTWMTINYGRHGGIISGKFYSVPTLVSRLGLESVFGDAIAGFLVSE